MGILRAGRGDLGDEGDLQREEKVMSTTAILPGHTTFSAICVFTVWINQEPARGMENE
jgi:hypothetical protein